MSVAYFLLLSSLGLAITTQAQHCSVPVGGENMGLKGDDILLEEFLNGVQVFFECDTGHITAGGSPSITCTDGSWSPVRLKCERRSCGSAGRGVDNGDIDYSEGIEFGDKLVVTCNPGYRLVGRSEIICGAQGWMDRLPECEVIQCKDPVIENAARDAGFLPSYNYTSTVTFKCIPGYTMKGEGTLTCGIDGQWSPGLPTCQPMTCSPPNPVVAGTFSPKEESYNVQQVVQFKCQGGYILKGSQSISCSEDGTFKPAPPTCVMVQCKHPDIKNAVWNAGSRSPHKYMSTVTYKCVPGYTMTTAHTLTCGIDSQWSPARPTCELISTTTRPSTTQKTIDDLGLADPPGNNGD